ncbi:MAG: hypothetical protein AAF934_10875, partial [Bacteroidota bacterium]
MKKTNIFLSLCMLILLFAGEVAKAQEPGKRLKGQTLELVNSGGGSFFSKLLQQEEENTVTLNVTVVEDGEDQLTLEIDYTGFENGRMSILLKDKFKREQRFIPGQEISLKGKSGPLEVTMSLGKKASKSLKQESAYVEIKIVERKVGALPTSKTFLYKLGKKWKKKIKTHKNVNVTLTPVGSTANLKEFDKSLFKPEFVPKFSNPMDGTWINNSPNTKDISKIVISGNASIISIYEKCDTKDCERGRKALTKDTLNTYSAAFPRSSLKLVLNKDLIVTQKITKRMRYNRRDNKQVTTTVFRKQLPPPQGPDNKPISLWGNIKMNTKFEFPHELSNIRTEKIYPDKNPKSGV